MCIFGMTKSRFFGDFAKHDFFMFYIFNMVLLFPNNDLKLNPYQQNWTHIRNIEIEHISTKLVWPYRTCHLPKMVLEVVRMTFYVYHRNAKWTLSRFNTKNIEIEPILTKLVWPYQTCHLPKIDLEVVKMTFYVYNRNAKW